jgi:hypothetical protein
MLSVKQTYGFFVRLVLLYGLLVMPWPGLLASYAAGYGAVGNAIFGSFGRDGVVRFEPLAAGREKMDTEISIGNLRTRPPPKRAEHSARLTGYLPTAEVVALILATPIAWRRRWKALLWGLLLVHGLIALRVTILLLYGFSGDHPCALYSPGPFWSNVLTKMYSLCAVWVSFTFVAPIFIWILVTFRRIDLQRWLVTIGDGQLAAGHPVNKAVKRPR